MARFHQILFTVSLLVICWLGMMAVHELGHVLGALATGGKVTQVVLHPLSISRTDVFPNPRPGIVVWCGPLVGVLLPLMAALLVPRKRPVVRTLTRFFAGFCLVANGAYIALGALDRVGDCGEMLRTGTPIGMLVLFGAVTMPTGLRLWHALGSVSRFFGDPTIVTRRMAYLSIGLLVGVLILEFNLSSR